MTVAEWMILAAVLIYLLTLAPFKPLGWRTFDNGKSRDPTFWAEPLRARALGAHVNGIETFPFFAAAVLLAEFRAVPQHSVDLLAMGFIALRLAFVAAYLFNYPWTRTLIWNAGFAVNVALFLSPWWAR